MTRREYTGAAPVTTLAASIASGTLAFTVTAGGGDGYPTGAVGPFFVVIDEGTANEEKILCSNRSGDLFNVAGSGRGADGTQAVSHDAGALVRHIYTATDADEANAHVNADSGHGTTSDVVGINDPQTLTNKTISGASNTFSNIPQSAVTNLGADFAAVDARLDTAEAELDQFNHAGTAAPAASSNASSWPLGLSVFLATTGNGYPINGILVTQRYTSTTHVVQELYEADTSATVRTRRWYRHWTGSAWTAWETDDDLIPAMVSADPDDSFAGTATFAATTNAVSQVFTAPPSGRVLILYDDVIVLTISANAVRTANGSFEVREGGTVGSGTVIQSPSDNLSVQARAAVSGQTVGVGAGIHHLLTGLTPGSQYNVRSMHRVSSTTSITTATTANRRLSVVPQH